MPDRAALVTGASSGIGLAIADLLGQEGYALTVAARRPDKLSAAADELRGKGYELEEVAAKRADMQLDLNLRARSSSSTANAPSCCAPPAPSTGTPWSSTCPRSPASRAPVGCRSTPATKAAVVGWTQSMNQELQNDGIKNVALCPAFVDTPMTDFIKGQVAPDKMIQTSDIAEAVRFLLRTTPYCLVPEIVFERPGASL
jgi:short-subunit dehydrogenase